MKRKIYKNENNLRNILSILVVAIFLILELLYLNIIPNSIFNGKFKFNLKDFLHKTIVSDSKLKTIGKNEFETTNNYKLELYDSTNKSLNNKKIFNGNYVVATVSESYFENTLFIGDSRMLGFSIYKQIPGATYYCYQSADAFTILNKEYELPPYGIISLYNLISLKRFDKIYMSLGINNVAAGLENHKKHYKYLLDTIISLQPNAIIYLLGNLHVTSQLINGNIYLNNMNINYINEFIREFEDKRQVFYLDPNVVYDDDFGNLNSELSYDYAHIYLRHYDKLLNFLLTNAVVYSE